MSQIGLDRWLKLFSFNGNPFANREAGTETLLNRYFVAPSYFDEIMGSALSPQTALVFAPRGGGKTAQRVMLDYHCHEQLFQGKVLSVLYTDFTPVVEAAGGDLSKLSARLHVVEILRRAVVSFSNFIIGNSDAVKHFHHLPEFERLNIRWFIYKYSNYISLRNIDNLENIGIKTTSENGGFYDDSTMTSSKMAHFLADKEHIPPADLLTNFADLMHSFGFDAVYILVDCVDEFQITAADPVAAVNLLEPLLSDLRIMNLSRAAFKFFLPLELEQIIKSRSAIRQDRLIFRRISWTDQSLIELLQKRLTAFSNYSSLAALCVPELRGRIEKEIIETAHGSPRNLIRLGNFLLSEHCELPMPDEETEWLITEKAWEAAKNKFNAENIHQWGQPPEIADPDNDILSLIKKGESSTLEFKATVRWNLKTNKPGKEIELAWLKTIVAFLNSEGGTVLIGIEDNGNIAGIESDLQNEDKCLRHLSNVIEQHIGLDFSKYIRYGIRSIKGKKIVIIRCEKSKNPAFLREQKEEDFYIRFGSSSKRLTKSEMLRYLEGVSVQ